MQYVNEFNQGLTDIAVGDSFSGGNGTTFRLLKVSARECEVCNEDTRELKTVPTAKIVRLGFRPIDAATGKAYGPYRSVTDAAFMQLVEVDYMRESL
jgi:hypothetical protein